MKQFKNYVSYSGNKEQLERYAAELINAGFRRCHNSNIYEDDSIYILSYRSGEFGFYNHTGAINPLQFEPGQFTEALKAATEPA